MAFGGFLSPPLASAAGLTSFFFFPCLYGFPSKKSHPAFFARREGKPFFLSSSFRAKGRRVATFPSLQVCFLSFPLRIPRVLAKSPILPVPSKPLSVWSRHERSSFFFFSSLRYQTDNFLSPLFPPEMETGFPSLFLLSGCRPFFFFLLLCDRIWMLRGFPFPSPPPNRPLPHR